MARPEKIGDQALILVIDQKCHQKFNLKKGTNNIVYGTIADIWKNDSASSFAIFQFCQSLSFAICFLIASKISLLVMISIISALTILSFLCFLTIDC